MKIHFIFLSLFLFLSCNFFGQEHTTKKKAKLLMDEINSLQAELEPKIQELIELKNGITEEEFTATDHSINEIYEGWKRGLENHKKQEIYMNNDLQVIKLEGLKKSLENIVNLVEEEDSLKK